MTSRRTLEGQAQEVILSQKCQHTFLMELPTFISFSVEWEPQGAREFVLLLPVSLHHAWHLVDINILLRARALAKPVVLSPKETKVALCQTSGRGGALGLR